MSDVDRMIKKRAKKSPGFAVKLKTTKSAISRLENSSGGVRLETLEKVAQAFGKEQVIEFR